MMLQKCFTMDTRDNRRNARAANDKNIQTESKAAAGQNVLIIVDAFQDSDVTRPNGKCLIWILHSNWLLSKVSVCIFK